ncbi:MAG: hypothetical protein HUJ75_01100, partial [Parasporobacterium sp.]|nr:hypothetical protein [Parasporobacterium sp.]
GAIAIPELRVFTTNVKMPVGVDIRNAQIKGRNLDIYARTGEFYVAAESDASSYGLAGFTSCESKITSDVKTTVDIMTEGQGATELMAFEKLHIYSNAEPTSAGTHFRVKSTAFAGAFIASAKATSTLEGKAYSNVYIKGNTTIICSDVLIDGTDFGTLNSVEAHGKAVGLGAGKSNPKNNLGRSNGDLVRIEQSVVFVIGQGVAGIYITIDENSDKSITIRSVGLPSSINPADIFDGKTIDLSKVNIQNNLPGKLIVPMYVDLSKNKIYGQVYINEIFVRNNTSYNLIVGQIVTYNPARATPLIQAKPGYKNALVDEAYKSNPVITISSKKNTSVALTGWIQNEKGKFIVTWDNMYASGSTATNNQILTSQDTTLRGGVKVAPLWIHDLTVINAAKICQITDTKAEADMEVYFSNALVNGKDASLRIENCGDVKIMPYIAEIIAQDFNDMDDNIWDTNVVTGNLVVEKQEAASLNISYGTPFRIYYLATAKSVKIVFPGSVEFTAELRPVSAEEAKTGFTLDQLGRYITGTYVSNVDVIPIDFNKILSQMKLDSGKSLTIDGAPNPDYYAVGDVPCIAYTLPNGITVYVVAEETRLGAVTYYKDEVYKIVSGDTTLETGMYQLCYDADGVPYMLFLNEHGAWLNLSTGLYSSGSSDSLVYLGYNTKSDKVLTEDIVQQFIIPDGDSVAIEHYNRFMDAKNNDVKDYDFLEAVPYYEKAFNGKHYTFFRMTDIMYVDSDMKCWSPVYAVMHGSELITVGRYCIDGQYTVLNNTTSIQFDSRTDRTTVLSLGAQLTEKTSDGQPLYVAVKVHHPAGVTSLDNPVTWEVGKVTLSNEGKIGAYYSASDVRIEACTNNWFKFNCPDDTVNRTFAQTQFYVNYNSGVDKGKYQYNFEFKIKLVNYANPSYEYVTGASNDYSLYRTEIVGAEEQKEQSNYIKETYAVQNAFGIEGLTIEGGKNAYDESLKDGFVPVVTYRLKNSIDAQEETLTVKRAYQASSKYTFFYIFHRELGLVAFQIDKGNKATRVFRNSKAALADPTVASNWNLLVPETQTLINEYPDPANANSKITESYTAYVYKTNKYNLVSYDRLFYTAYDKANGTELGTYQIVYNTASAFGPASYGNNTSSTNRLNNALKESGAYIVVPAYKQIRLVMLDGTGTANSAPADKVFNYANEGFVKQTAIAGADTVYRIKSGIWVNKAGEVLSREQTQVSNQYNTQYIQYQSPVVINGELKSSLIAGRSSSNTAAPVANNTKWIKVSQTFNQGAADTTLNINGNVYIERISEDYAVDIFDKVYMKGSVGITETWNDLTSQYVLGTDDKIYLNGKEVYAKKADFEQAVTAGKSEGNYTSLIGQGSNYGKLYIYNGKFMLIQRDRGTFTGLGEAYVTNDAFYNTAVSLSGTNKQMWFLKEWTISSDKLRREMVYQIYDNGVVLWDINKKYAAEKYVGGDASETGEANYIIKDTSPVNKLVVYSGANVQANNSDLKINELIIKGDTVFTDYFDTGHYGKNYTKAEIAAILNDSSAAYLNFNDTVNVTGGTGVAYNTLESNTTHLDQAIKGTSTTMSASDWLDSNYRAWRFSSKVTATYTVQDDDGNNITKTKKSPVLVKVTGGILSTPNASNVDIGSVTMSDNATLILMPSTKLTIGEIDAVNGLIKMGSDQKPIPITFNGVYDSSTTNTVENTPITIYGTTVDMQNVKISGNTVFTVTADNAVTINGDITGNGQTDITMRAPSVKKLYSSAGSRSIIGDDITIVADIIDIADINATGKVELESVDKLRLDGNITAGGDVIITSSEGDVDVAGKIISGTGAVTVEACEHINLTGVAA